MKRTQEEIKKIRSSRLWRDKVRITQLFLFPWCNKCEIDGEEPTEAEQVDHIIPLEDGGEPFDPANLQSLCFRCHVIKSADENRKRLKIKKETNANKRPVMRYTGKR